MNERIRETTAKHIIRDKGNFTIGKISLWKIFAYFVVYSIAGFIIETLFAIVRTGNLESRQSFLYGPFCAIYGLGAVILIVFLQFFQKNNYTLFFFGILIGAITEYFVSFIGEWLFNTKWWDYSDFPLNINGRICLLYSVFWGILALVLLKYINPLIDKMFIFFKEKININILKTFLLIVVIFMALDYIVSCFAITAFLSRTIVNNNIEVANKTKIQNEYNIIYSTNFVTNFINKYFGNEKMVKTFPRLKIETINGEIVHVYDLYPDIQPYYIKIKK